MEPSRLPLSLTPPSPELETLVELLVDDELDAVERRALLERLDAVDGGWKYCATAFLEAQTFRKAFRAFAKPERDALAAFNDSNNFSAFNGSNNFNNFNAANSCNNSNSCNDSNGFNNSNGFNDSNASTVANAFAPLTAAGINAETDDDSNLRDNVANADAPGDFNAYNDFAPFNQFNQPNQPNQLASSNQLNAADVPLGLFAASRRDLPEPRIIPLNSVSSRGGLRRSSFGSGGSNGDGPRRFPRFAATTAGLLLSVAFGALLYRQLAPTSPALAPRSPRLDAVANVETPSAPPRRASHPSAPSFAKVVGNSAPSASSASSASASPIRFVTLRSPSRSIDDVAVPCVEGDLNDLAALRATRADLPDVPPQIVEALRTSGGRVQTIRDEFRFPLEDGRTLVLPVDVYEIRAVSVSIN